MIGFLNLTYGSCSWTRPGDDDAGRRLYVVAAAGGGVDVDGAASGGGRPKMAPREGTALGA